MDKKKDQRLTVLIHEHEHMIAVAVSNISNWTFPELFEGLEGGGEESPNKKTNYVIIN